MRRLLDPDPTPRRLVDPEAAVRLLGVTSTPASLLPPTGVSLTPGNSQITVNWTVNPLATSTKVYRGLVSGVLQQVAAVSAPTATFADTGLTPLLPYIYALSSDDGVTETALTSEYAASPLDSRSTWDYRIETDDPTGAHVGAATFYVYNASSVLQSTHADTGTTSGLKAALDTYKASNIWFKFGWGEFHFPDYTGENHATFNTLNNMIFEGSGMRGAFKTLITGTITEANDTEPLSFTACDSIQIRDMEVLAGGTARSTSDALDFDDANHALIERVHILASRARGIVFDGKDPSASADFNVIRDCLATVAQAVQGDAFEILAGQYNLLKRVWAYRCGQYGAQLVKGTGGSGRLASFNVIEDSSFVRSDDDGVNITSGSNNIIRRSLVDGNNFDAAGSHDGVKIGTADDVDADNNEIRDNWISDTQGTKTQDRGIQLTESGLAAINDTIIDGNYLQDNLNGPLTDGGTNTVDTNNIISGGETTFAPPPPVAVMAVESGADVVVSWYDPPAADLASLTVYRGASVATLASLATGVAKIASPDITDASTYLNSYVDAGAAGNGYTYAVTAVDDDANESALANASTALTRAEPVGVQELDIQGMTAGQDATGVSGMWVSGVVADTNVVDRGGGLMEINWDPAVAVWQALSLDAAGTVSGDFDLRVLWRDVTNMNGQMMGLGACLGGTGTPNLETGYYFGNNTASNMEVREFVAGSGDISTTQAYTFTIQTERYFYLRRRGNTYNFKVWPSASSEPDWTDTGSVLTHTDASYTSGLIGIVANSGAAKQIREVKWTLAGIAIQ